MWDKCNLYFMFLLVKKNVHNMLLELIELLLNVFFLNFGKINQIIKLFK